MKQKIIQHIENLIQEHWDSGYATNKDHVSKALEHFDAEEAFNKQYDVARYETLCNLLTDIENMEE